MIERIVNVWDYMTDEHPILLSILCVAAVVLLVLLAVMIYTATPYTTTDCLKHHYNPVITCIPNGKSVSCTTSYTYICDVQSSPTPNTGWLIKH